jgi:hypothetical protein
MLLELQARCPVAGPLQLEYQGIAVPALDPMERHRLNQNLGVAIPLGGAGHLRLGARHQWEDTLTPTKTWADGMQLYLGVGLRR